MMLKMRRVKLCRQCFLASWKTVFLISIVNDGPIICLLLIFVSVLVVELGCYMYSPVHACLSCSL